MAIQTIVEENVMSPTKPEAHNVSQRRRKRTATVNGKMHKHFGKDRACGSGDVDVDRQTDTHTQRRRLLFTILRNRFRGQSKIVYFSDADCRTKQWTLNIRIILVVNKNEVTEITTLFPHFSIAWFRRFAAIVHIYYLIAVYYYYSARNGRSGSVLSGVAAVTINWYPGDATITSKI